MIKKPVKIYNTPTSNDKELINRPASLKKSKANPKETKEEKHDAKSNKHVAKMEKRLESTKSGSRGRK